MRHAIDLDDQLAVECDEVDHIPVDRMLATKFPPCQPPVAQRLPQLRFSTRL
jgi:hypothetical protein